MRHLRTILLFLLLGAVVNVAVAWGLAWSANPMLTVPTHPDGFGLSSDSGRCWFVSFGHMVGRTWLSRTAKSDETRRKLNNPQVMAITEELPSWSRCTTLPTVEETYPEYPERSILELAFGWPLLTNVYEVHTVRHYHKGKLAVVNHVSGGFSIRPMVSPPLTRGLSPTWSKAYALPFKVILPGLVFNSFTFTALLWLLIHGPFALRRHLRRKRGLCVKCAYDLKGAEHEACPECGLECPSS